MDVHLCRVCGFHVGRWAWSDICGVMGTRQDEAYVSHIVVTATGCVPRGITQRPDVHTTKDMLVPYPTSSVILSRRVRVVDPRSTIATNRGVYQLC